jgi:hypothetical protein
MQRGCAAIDRHFYICGFDPLTPTTYKAWGPLLVAADESAATIHPLPQGGEGSEFTRSRSFQKYDTRGHKCRDFS